MDEILLWVSRLRGPQVIVARKGERYMVFQKDRIRPPLKGDSPQWKELGEEKIKYILKNMFEKGWDMTLLK